MPKGRLTGNVGRRTSNRGPQKKRYNNYMRRLMIATNAVKKDDTITLDKIRNMYLAARQSHIVPKGVNKLLKSIVRQRT